MDWCIYWWWWFNSS